VGVNDFSLSIIGSSASAIGLASENRSVRDKKMRIDIMI